MCHGRVTVDIASAGHVDNFACFAAPGVVCLAWTDDQSDPQVILFSVFSASAPAALTRSRLTGRYRASSLLRVPMQYERSAEALEYLNSQTDAEGRQLRVIKIPLPPPLFYTKVGAVKPLPWWLKSRAATCVLQWSSGMCSVQVLAGLSYPQPTTACVLPHTNPAMPCTRSAQSCCEHYAGRGVGRPAERRSGGEVSGRAVGSVVREFPHHQPRRRHASLRIARS